MTPTDTALDVELSIVNTNNRDLLRACLASIAGACEGLRWHATVVDNASTDGSAELVLTNYPNMTLLRNRTRLGFSANHNQVLRPWLDQSKARYCLILNEDTTLDRGSLAELVAFADGHARTGAIGPAISGSDGLPQPSLFPFPTVLDQARAALRPAAQLVKPGRAGWLNGSCLLLRLEALRQIGPLDERFFIFFEDTDLGLRLSQAGWECAVCDRARITHLGHRTVSKPTLSSAMERQVRRSQYLYFRKHRGWLEAAMLSALVRLALGMRAIKALAAGMVRRDGAEWTLGTLMVALAAYRPSVALPHEVTATHSPLEEASK
jgi:GT2 family glycosyltransferase